MHITDDEFDKLISLAMDELPQEYIKGLDNVAIVYADEPSDVQRQHARLEEDSILLGLYEGIPLTQRGNHYNLAVPDKITLFKTGILRVTHDATSLFEQIKRTLWHEIAHYYGLNHARIHEIQDRL